MPLVFSPKSATAIFPLILIIFVHNRLLFRMISIDWNTLYVWFMTVKHTHTYWSNLSLQSGNLDVLACIFLPKQLNWFPKENLLTSSTYYYVLYHKKLHYMTTTDADLYLCERLLIYKLKILPNKYDWSISIKYNHS